MDRALPRPLTIGSVSPWWSALIFVPIALVIGWSVTVAPFGPRDDHQIVAILGSDHRLAWNALPDMAWSLATGDEGRFRPLYWPARALEAAVWGDNVAVWHIAHLILGLIATGLLVALIGGWAGVAVALLLWAGPQAEVWYQLAPNEAYALPLTLGGLLAWRGGHRWWAVGVLLTAALFKESFVVLNCSLVVLWWWHERQWSLPLTAFGVGTGVCAAAVAWAARAGDIYAGERSLQSFLGSLGAVGAVGLGVIVVGLLAFRAPRVAPAFGAAAIVILPQAWVMAGFGATPPGRILLPALLGFALIESVVIRHRPWLAAVLIIGLVPGMFIAVQHAQIEAARAGRLDATVRAIESARQPDDQLVFALRDGRDHEWMKAIARRLVFDGYTVAPAVSIIGPPSGDGFEARLREWQEEQVAPVGPVREPCLVIHHPDLEPEPQCRSLIAEGWG